MPAARSVRYARGLQRRGALISAAADLLLEQGLSALSHRAVAARAGLPLAATTYYFSSVDDLRDEALRQVADAWLTRAGALVDGLPSRLEAAQAVQVVVGILGADRPGPQLLLLYERYLEAARHERLRPLVLAYNAQVGELVRKVLVRSGSPAGEGDVRLVLAVADGAAVTALAEGAPPDLAVREALGRLLALLRRDSSAGSVRPGVDPGVRRVSDS